MTSTASLTASAFPRAHQGDYDNDGRDDLYVSTVQRAERARVRIPGLNPLFTDSTAGISLPRQCRRHFLGRRWRRPVPAGGMVLGRLFCRHDNDSFLISMSERLFGPGTPPAWT
jgi:hypothetical protein